MNRREFVVQATATATTAWLAAQEKRSVPASEKITFALIGCGGMGRANLRDFVRLPDFVCVALCDVDKNQIAGAMDDLKKAGRPTDSVAVYEDYRKMLGRT
jgi:predicted dehydrogenase